ncbi:hypothetical protein HDE78_000316 [Rhodanobacter sp. K2T2]|uniref:hypothetical protein n=1 Tax=Rhodanobacter sp. K2T2 TaxID=2723085 RepID=UPI0015CA7B5A|nr:hypothetical protein [Rhodanobacter sp. K2T2]NYE27391.1 hypothetical protein [Rhodanobacter sp. K2T2]
MLNSDALGKKGESRFREMCSDVDLPFNASLDWDKAGWDFIIDFPMPVNERRSLDHRGSPQACRVQQKTVMDSTPSVTLSLKMAERLAKDLMPSFISMFKVSEALEFTGGYLMHIAGDRLSAILKRLRELGPDASDEDMKGKKISFSPTEQERIAMTGVALVERLRTHIGDDIHGYTAKKKKELDELGYGEDAYASRFEVNAEDLQAFSNMFLGLVSQVEVRNIVVTENRFGIPIVDTTSEMAVMSVEHASTRQCTAVFADEEIGERGVFRGTARITPPGLARKMRLQFQWFSVFMDIDSAENNLSFTFTPGEADGIVDQWLEYWRAMKLVKARRGTVRLGIDGNPNIGELPMLPRERGSPYEDFDDLFDAFETLSLIARRGGLAHEASFRFQEVAEAEHDLARVRALLDGGIKSIKNQALGDLNALPQLPEKMLYANGVKVGEHVIAYCVVGKPVCTPKGNAVVIELIELSSPWFGVVDSAASYQAFIDSNMAKANVTAVMAAKPSE